MLTERMMDTSSRTWELRALCWLYDLFSKSETSLSVSFITDKRKLITPLPGCLEALIDTKAL